MLSEEWKDEYWTEVTDRVEEFIAHSLSSNTLGLVACRENNTKDSNASTSSGGCRLFAQYV
ncbi:hypothetical protein EON64_11410 [archaeon]|nr:MAG: hypothetical protein EON64_11410 [archaeon]